MPKSVMEEFIGTTRGLQENKLRELAIGVKERAQEPGSLENLQRDLLTKQTEASLQNFPEAQRLAELQQYQQALSAQENLMVERLDKGESPALVAKDAIDQGWKPKGYRIKYMSIDPDDPNAPKRPFAYNPTIPGLEEPRPISDQDEQDMIKHHRAKSLAKAKSKTTKTGKRPDKTVLANIKAIAISDETLQDLDEESMDAFVATVANKAQGLMEENPGLTFEKAQEIAYDAVYQTHIQSGEESPWWNPFDWDEPAKFTRKKGTAQGIRRQTEDGRIALFDPITKKFIRYED